MLYRKVIAVFSLCFLAIVGGMPQSNANVNKDASAGLPLIQFTNGGIRLNFAGYHAEAGLGGLLGGGRTAGGLHASAGTPWGANAAAGLGGLLGGDNANTGGGLFARAGLGNGGPQAAAGLGGILDGSGRSVPASGGLFAGATMGSRSVRLASGTPSNGPASAGSETRTSEGTSDSGRPSGGRTNIQIISRAEKKPEQIKQVASEATGTAELLKQVDRATNKEVREVESTQLLPVATGGIFGTLSVNPAPVLAPSDEKVKILGGIVDAIEPALPASPLPEANEILQIDNRPARVKIVYPKWVVRKRFWGPRKQIIYNASAEVENPIDTNTRKRSPRQTGASGDRPPATNGVPVQNGNSGTIDDIFKIPIATLNAVNQVLSNNSG